MALSFNFFMGDETVEIGDLWFLFLVLKRFDSVVYLPICTQSLPGTINHVTWFSLGFLLHHIVAVLTRAKYFKFVTLLGAKQEEERDRSAINI